MISSGLFSWLMGVICCAAMLCPSFVRAQMTHTVYINFNGSYGTPACTPNIYRQLMAGSYNTASTVTLPGVLTSQLNYSGATYGNVTLQFRANGCTGNVNNMWVHFTSANVDGNGRIIPGNSSQLRFEIRDGNVNGALIRVGGSAGNTPGSGQGSAAPFSGSHPANDNRVADKYYGIRYYAQSAVTVAGYYSATVTANFKYY